MSRQDTQRCAKCGELCGHDNWKGNWLEGDNLAICEQCKENMRSRFFAFFGFGTSSDDSGLILEWPEVDKILSKIKRDAALRVSYITTDKELYERTAQISTPVESEE